jgi:hypothetical protein
MIITTEPGINNLDKITNKPFVVSFDFVAPEPESVIFSTNSHGSGSNKIVVDKSDKVEFEFGFGGLLQIYIPKYEGNWKNPGTKRLQAEFKLIHDSDPPPAVPEPATMFLLGSGLIGLAGFVRRKCRK